MLTGKQKRFLRSKGQTMWPLLQVGKNELTQSFFDQLSAALEKRELVKVSLLQATDLSAQEVGDWLVTQDSKIEVAQTIGRTLLVYRPSSKTKNQVISTQLEAI